MSLIMEEYNWKGLHKKMGISSSIQLVKHNKLKGLNKMMDPKLMKKWLMMSQIPLWLMKVYRLDQYIQMERYNWFQRMAKKASVC